MRPSILAIFALATAGSASADEFKLQSLDGTVSFSGSYGLTSIRANELVFEGKAKVSQLIWKSNFVSTLNGAVKVALTQDWYFNASGTIGLGGNGHMADYDWLQPGQPWSDRSLHPDTRLDHYFVAGIEAGRTLVSRDGTDIGLGVGFKYTDVQWSAYGGSYIYSENGFRDSRGHFPRGEKGISFRQSWPVPYLGLNLSHHDGPWTFAAALQAGVTVKADDIDDHWVRSLRFYDYLETAPTLSLASSVDYTVWNNASLYLSGSFDKMFRARADTKQVDNTNGKVDWYPNSAGGDFRSATVSFGLKGRF
jgi:omptin